MMLVENARTTNKHNTAKRIFVARSLGGGSLQNSLSLEIDSVFALCDHWLILPVVLCLSQSLSHACLSPDFGLNHGSLIISVIIAKCFAARVTVPILELIRCFMGCVPRAHISHVVTIGQSLRM